MNREKNIYYVPAPPTKNLKKYKLALLYQNTPTLGHFQVKVQLCYSKNIWQQCKNSHLVEWQRVLEENISSYQGNAEFKMAKHVVAGKTGLKANNWHTIPKNKLWWKPFAAVSELSFFTRLLWMEMLSRIRNCRRVSNDPVDGQVDQERHHPGEKHRHLENKRAFLQRGAPNVRREKQHASVLRPTRAGRDHGANIPPSPVSGSKNGIMASRTPDDRGAW